jgi:hypothetical protein
MKATILPVPVFSLRRIETPYERTPRYKNFAHSAACESPYRLLSPPREVQHGSGEDRSWPSPVWDIRLAAKPGQRQIDPSTRRVFEG